MTSKYGKGGSGEQWGGGVNPGDELEQLIARARQWLRQFMPGGGSGSVIMLVAIAALLVGAWTAYYTVPSDSVAVVQRFGLTAARGQTEACIDVDALRGELNGT